MRRTNVMTGIPAEPLLRLNVEKHLDAELQHYF